MGEEGRSRRGSYDRNMSSEERAAEQRERIIDAATTLYGEKGYYETRLEDIVARAQVSRRTVYAHFRDLGQLRFSVFERAMSRTLVLMAQVAADHASEDRLQEVLRTMFETIAEFPHLSRAVAYEFRLPEPRNVALRKQTLSFFVSLLMEGTRDDHALGKTPRPPDELTMWALLGAIEGLALRYIDGDDTANALEALPTALAVYRSVYPFTP